MTDEQRERQREYQRRWRAANPDKVREQKARYQAANPEKAREGRRRWRQANPEKAKAATKRWREANREHVETVRKAWVEANPDRAAYHGFVYRLNNPEKEAERRRRYIAKDPERYRRQQNRKPSTKRKAATRNRRRYVARVKDQAALVALIRSRVLAPLPANLPASVRDSVASMAVERVFRGLLPIRFSNADAKALLKEYRAEFERSEPDTTSLDTARTATGETLHNIVTARLW